MNYNKAVEYAHKGNILKRVNHDVQMDYDPFGEKLIFQINGKILEECRFSDKLAVVWEVIYPTDQISVNPFLPLVWLNGEDVKSPNGGTIYA